MIRSLLPVFSVSTLILTPAPAATAQPTERKPLEVLQPLADKTVANTQLSSFKYVMQPKNSDAEIVDFGQTFPAAEPGVAYSFSTIYSVKDQLVPKILSKASFETMVRHLQGGYGLGFSLYQKDFSYFGHRGHNSGYMSRMILHKQRGYGVVVLTNGENDAFIEEVIRSVAATYSWENFSF